MKRLLILATLLILFPRQASTDSFDIKFGIGPGFYFGNPEILEDGVRWQMLPVILDVGYNLNDNISLDLEGQFWWYWGAGMGHPSVYFGSLIGYYKFASEASSVTPYALLGLGYGYVLFTDIKRDDLGGSGNLHIQIGGGIAFDISERFEIGVETRLRIGVPTNPDVVTMAMLCVFMVSL